MTELTADGFPEVAVRRRAREGVAQAFPPADRYGRGMFGAGSGAGEAPGLPRDALDAWRIVPPVFMPNRLEKLIELGREPLPADVDLHTDIGGFSSPVPVFVSAFGSTQIAGRGTGVDAARQAGQLGVPLVVGENITATSGYGRQGERSPSSLLERLSAYARAVGPDHGGVVVQQSTEDADAEVWNLVYSDPGAAPLLDSGRLGFELKVGQGAKPGLGGMTLLDPDARAALSGGYAFDDLYGPDERSLRTSSPGTFTRDILHHQIRLMRNNYPRCRVWVKLPPGRDVADAVAVAWAAGVDAVTVDGAEAGTGWAPSAFLDHVGLPLGECLSRIGPGPADRSLLATGRIWEGTRAIKAMALGARAVGLGRSALLAADEDPALGLTRLVECMAFEMRLLLSALGWYTASAVNRDDLWAPAGNGPDGT